MENTMNDSTLQKQDEATSAASGLNAGLGMGKECYSCGKTYEYTDDDFYTSCDTVDGQYVEREVTKCPFCFCENW